MTTPLPDPLAGEVTGVGLVAVMEPAADRETRAPFPPEMKVGPCLAARAEDHGLIVRAVGDRIGFSAPLIITPDHSADRYARFGAALDETHG